MPKIILEKIDIEKLIKEKYHTTSIEGISDDIEISIRVEDVTPKAMVHSTIPPKIIQENNDKIDSDLLRKKQALLSDGSIDADKAGLSVQPRKDTVPGGAMGQQRGRLPVF